MPYIAVTDDDLVARLLVDTWTLTTGRVLRSDVPPQDLTEQELIEFWADDHFEPAAGHLRASKLCCAHFVGDTVAGLIVQTGSQ